VRTAHGGDAGLAGAWACGCGWAARLAFGGSDKKIADERIRNSGLDWAVVYPTRLTHGPANGAYSAGDRLPMKGNPTISRADVAAFIQKAAHGAEWIRRSPESTD
jgi:hypothetical protein